tara:strand:+ start:116091 stop:116321 length:231 start_codon:yes stop_codon:yes gene_type:complete
MGEAPTMKKFNWLLWVGFSSGMFVLLVAFQYFFPAWGDQRDYSFLLANAVISGFLYTLIMPWVTKKFGSKPKGSDD